MEISIEINKEGIVWELYVWLLILRGIVTGDEYGIEERGIEEQMQTG